MDSLSHLNFAGGVIMHRLSLAVLGVVFFALLVGWPHSPLAEGEDQRPATKNLSTPVAGPATRRVAQTRYRPVTETVLKKVPYTVSRTTENGKIIQETHYKDVAYTVTRMAPEVVWVEVPANAPAGAELVRADEPADENEAKKYSKPLTDALAHLHLHPRDPYLQYVVLQLARRENQFEEVSHEVQRLMGLEDRRGRRQNVDLFSLFSGALAVQENLQLDTMRGERAGRRTIEPALSQLDEDELPPFEEDPVKAGVKLPTRIDRVPETKEVTEEVIVDGKVIKRAKKITVEAEVTVQIQLTPEERQRYEAWEKQRVAYQAALKQRDEKRAAAEEKRRKEEENLTPEQVQEKREQEQKDHEEKRRKELVSVADLKGPTVKSHPWAKMLGDKKPVVDPLAKLVPEDFYFIGFRSINKLMEVMELSDLWGTHLNNQAWRDARSHNVGDKLKRQLAIETNPLVKPFYDLIVEEVAVVGSDLFLREGSDVTLLFRYKQPQVFQARMDGFLKNAEKARPDAKRGEGQYLGVKYVSLTTPDRDLSVFSAYPGKDLHIRSNSLAALQRVLEAHQGKTVDGKPASRLGDSTEFTYIRALLPRDSQEEDGLIYLSDPFIRRLMGPQVKLTERRRMLCYNHLKMIGHAALLYHGEQRKPALSLESLFDSKCCPQPFHALKPVDPKKLAQLIADLDSEKFAVRQQATADLEKLATSAEAELQKALEKKPSLEVTRRLEDILLKVDRLCACPSGGAYKLSADGMTGSCTHHGHIHFLTPNLETPTLKVRGDEADEYRWFLQEYNQYWRTFFDPIAIRVKITPERYRLETVVLPLIDNSIYTGLAHALGGKPAHFDVLPVPKRNIFSLALKFDKEKLLKDMKPKDFDDIRSLPRALGVRNVDVNKLDFHKLFVQGFGDQIGLHLYDAPPNFDFNFPQAMGWLMTDGVRSQGSGNNDVPGLSLNLIAGFMQYALIGASFNGPAYLSLPVNDAKIVDEFGDQLELVFAALARSSYSLAAGFVATDFYRVPFKAGPKQSMRCFGVRVGPLKLRYFWARIGQTVYIASQPTVLDDLLALEKERAKPDGAKPQAPETAHALFKIRAANWNEVLPNTWLGWAENHREACINNQGPLSSVARSFTPSLGKIDEKELAAVAGRVQQQADRLHQAHFFCPEGGHYLLNPDGRAMAMTCSVHGSALAPRQPATAGNSSLNQQLERFGGMTATLNFLEDGLRAVVIIERK
jgi:hypothetical protein